MIKKCSCKEWEDNIEILNAPFNMGLIAVGEYRGKIFDFCPWCGKSLDMVETIKRLVEALESDKGYRMTWKANIAMAFQDCYQGKDNTIDIYHTANRAADQFLDNLCKEKKES